MVASELRIGNLVNYEQTTHVITNLNKDYCSSMWIDDDDIRNPYIHNYENIKPIRLTDEWLGKFGFINNYKQILLLNWGFWCEFEEDIGWIISQGFKNKRSELCSIIFVNQLQNLYFALTNEELIFK